MQHITWDPIMAEKGGFKHFMLKEIFEQPRAVRDTSLGRISLDTGKVFLEQMDVSEAEFKSLTKVQVVACGTSWHAGLAGKYMIERLARVPVEVDYGSEYRYRDPIMGENELTIVITQSGETADTIAAQREAKAQGLQDAGHLQRGGRHDRPRSRWHHLHPRRAGDRRGLHQGIHQRNWRRCFCSPFIWGRCAERFPTEQSRAAAGRAGQDAGQTGNRAHAGRRAGGPGQAITAARRTSCSSAAACTSRSRWKAR